MPPSVLVVEDESDLSQLIGDSLQAAGFQPVMVSTAAEARTRLDGFAYDALVVDLRLPDADGMDVLERRSIATRHPLGRHDRLRRRRRSRRRDQARRAGLPHQAVPARRLARVLHRGLEQQRLREENAELRAQLHDRFRFDSIIGQSTRCGRSSRRWSSSRR